MPISAYSPVKLATDVRSRRPSIAMLHDFLHKLMDQLDLLVWHTLAISARSTVNILTADVVPEITKVCIHLTHLTVLVVDIRLATEHLLPYILFNAFPHRSTSLRIHGHRDQEANLREIDYVEIERQRVRNGGSNLTCDLREQAVDPIV